MNYVFYLFILIFLFLLFYFIYFFALFFFSKNIKEKFKWKGKKKIFSVLFAEVWKSHSLKKTTRK